MLQKKSAKIQSHFAELTDPRVRKVTDPLINVVAIAEFGRKKREGLARFLDLEKGIPSHDRFNAILAAIQPAEFEKCLLRWITALRLLKNNSTLKVGIKNKRLTAAWDESYPEEVLVGN
jgi:hypothetical protein